MNEDQQGIILRASADTWATGANFQVKLDFLQQARRFTAPEVAEIIVRFKGDVTAGGGGDALGRDAAKLFSNVRLSDIGGEIVNASGAMLRIQEQLEYGAAVADPAAVTSSGTTTGYLYKLRICFQPKKSLRPRDYRIPLVHFLEGGDLVISTASALPTNWSSIANGTVQVFMRVVDGRVPETKSRMTLIERNVSQQEFDYQVGGALRSMFVASKLTTTGYTSMATYTSLNSSSAAWPANFETDLLVDRYRSESEAHGTADEFLLSTPGALPIVLPNRRQKVGEMIDTRTFHLNLGAAAPSSGKVLVCAIQDRNPTLAAMVAGFGSPGEYQQALQSGLGHVVDEKSTPANAFLPALARKLPIRFKGLVR